ncbi:MAG TPA: sigma-70 family RNA polymerase sigma factor, partial [Tepidisphaeraceae bacterium]
MDEFALLQEYARSGSQDAYGRLVERYARLVYAAARRQVRDKHLAEDVTQAVFVVLAQKAGTIRPGRPLSAWLLTTTRHTCSNAMRLARRRLAIESRAAQMRSEAMDTSDEADPHSREMEVLLDEAMGRLKGRDRDALLLRFFEQKSLRDVGQMLGISEEAAQKRVTRAVDRLREFFQRRGVTTALSAGAVATFLASRATEAAPAGLTAAISAGKIGGTAATAALVKGAIIMTTAQKVTAAIVAVVLLLGVGGGIIMISQMRTTHIHDTMIAPQNSGPAPKVSPQSIGRWA